MTHRLSTPDFEYDYFNKKKASNYAHYRQKDLFPSFFQYTQSLTRAFHPRRVLDIGCAKGYWVLAFHRLGINAAGVDISRYAIEHGHPFVKDNLQVVNVETQPLPYPANSFDLIVSSEVIEHLADHQFFLAEIKRVLTPKGHVLFTTPSHNLLDSNGQALDKTHVSVFLRSRWLKLFAHSGFTNQTGFIYFKILAGFASGMSQVPAKSPLGIKLKKYGKIGSLVRYLILLFDVFTHYQTDIFLLQKTN